jgi:hypothetical protein
MDGRMVTDASSLHLMQGRVRLKGVMVGRLETATRRGESDRVVKPLHRPDGGSDRVERGSNSTPGYVGQAGGHLGVPGFDSTCCSIRIVPSESRSSPAHVVLLGNNSDNIRALVA